MEASAGSMSFDARTASLLQSAGAEIKMYGLDALGYTEEPSITVRDDEGAIIDEPGIVSHVSYSEAR